MKKDSIIQKLRIYGIIIFLSFLFFSITIDVISTFLDYQSRKNIITQKYYNAKKNMIKQEVLKVFDYIESSRAEKSDFVKANLKEEADKFYTLIETTYNNYYKSASIKEFDEFIFNFIREYRYEDGKGYFFIISDSGRLIFHPVLNQVENETSDALEYKDGNGIMFIKDFISNIGDEDLFFHEYFWKDKDMKEPEKKIGCFRRFNQKKWIIGTGLYEKDIDKNLKEEFLKHIGKIRFDENRQNYIFVVSYDGVTLMNDTQRELIGLNIWEMEDPDGVKVIQEERKAVENPEGDYIYYSWKKPGKDETVSKISFMKGVADWEWMIGAGVYVDEVENNINILKQDILNRLKYNLLIDVLFIIIVFAFIWIIILGIFKKLKITFLNFIENVKHAILSGNTIDYEEAEFSEFEALIDRFNIIINKKIEAERTLRDERRRLSSIIQGTRVGTWEWNINTGNTIFNDYWAEMLGYSLEELYPYSVNTWASLVHEDDIEEAKNALERHIKGKTSYYECEFRMRHKNGYYVWILDRGKISLRDETGNPILFSGTHIDITERKDYEQKLRNAEKFITDIIDSMPSMIIAVDQNGDINQINRTAVEKLDILPQDAVGKNLTEILKRFENYISIIMKSIKNNETSIFNKKTYNESDNIIYEEVSVFPLTDKGAVIRIDDITEKVNLENILIQNEKMMSVGGLAAGMAHEINNPLAGILQGVQNITRRLDPAQSKNIEEAKNIGLDMNIFEKYIENRKIRVFLAGIKESGERASKIVNNMLEFSRQCSVEKTSRNLNILLDKTIEISKSDYDLKKKYDFKFIEFLKDYKHDLTEVDVLELDIEQVFLNIIKNAAQAMFDNNVKKPTIKIHTYEDRENVFVKISDNGPGISEELSRRIFEPFFTTKIVGEGTGLGLSVSYFIVKEKHGGDIWVESQPGYGAVFVIRFPKRLLTI